MKKVFILFLVLSFCFFVVGCTRGGKVLPNGSSNPPSDSAQIPNQPPVDSPNLPGESPDIPSKQEWKIQLAVGEKYFFATLYENETTKQFMQMLPLTFVMSDLNANEKFYYLPQNLPTNTQNVGRINAGDIMLYGENCFVIFYKSFSTSYRYTKLGHVEDVGSFQLALAKESVMIGFSLEEGK